MTEHPEMDWSHLLTPVPTPREQVSTTGTKYRWECRDCHSRGNKRWHGRWYTDGNTAKAMAWGHLDKYKSGHEPRLVDDAGQDCGPAC